MQAYLARPGAIARLDADTRQHAPGLIRLGNARADTSQTPELIAEACVGRAGPCTRVWAELDARRVGESRGAWLVRRAALARRLVLVREDTRRIHAGMLASSLPRRVVVTGASGAIGRRLCPFLEACGVRVERYVRAKPARREAGEFFWDADGVIDPEPLEGADAVIHLAGEPAGRLRWDRDAARRVRESRVRGTTLLARAIASCERPPAVLLSASGVHVYGDRGDEPVSEDAGPGTGYFAEVAREWEAAALLAAYGPAQHAPRGAGAVRVVLLRIGMVLGQGGGVLGAMQGPFALGLGAIPGSGAQWWPWVAMEDVLGAVLHACCTQGVHGPVNVVAPEEARAAEVCRTLAHVMGQGLVASAPRALLRLALGQGAEAACASVRGVGERLRAGGFTFTQPTLEGALRWELSRAGPLALGVDEAREG